MLKGRLPFDAAEEDKMLWRIVKSKPRYDPGWRKDTLEVLRALLQKRPATRLCTLRDVGNMNLKPAPVAVDGPDRVDTADQPVPENEDEDVMDYFRKLADS